MSEIYRPLQWQAGQRGLDVRDMGKKNNPQNRSVKKGRFVEVDLKREGIKKCIGYIHLLEYRRLFEY